jgi:Rgg/GadR/MutR family transcriptional activator
LKQGEIIKQLRLERGMTQGALSEGISTRTTLSSFECRKTELSSSILLGYLDKLNVKYNEFKFLMNENKLSKKEGIIRDFIYILENNCKRDELELFLRKVENLYCLYHDVFYQMAIAQLKILRSKELGIGAKEEEETIQMIKDYLFQVENWCHFELTIFSNVLFIFSSEEIIVQFENVISKMWIFHDEVHYNSLLSTFLINGCFLGFERGNLKIIKLFTRYLEIISKSPRFIESRIYLLIFKGLLPGCENKSLDSKSIESGLTILDILNPMKANVVRDFIFQCLENKGFAVYTNLNS